MLSATDHDPASFAMIQPDNRVGAPRPGGREALGASLLRNELRSIIIFYFLSHSDQ